jgi:hypothetical protein
MVDTCGRTSFLDLRYLLMKALAHLVAGELATLAAISSKTGSCSSMTLA